MKMSIRSLAALTGAALLASVSLAGAADSPFLGSKSDTHGTLYLNVDKRASQIYPVNIWAVDGKLTNRDDQGVLWVKPGEYTFTFKVAKDYNLTVNKPGAIASQERVQGVNMADAPGLQRDSANSSEDHVLKVTVEAGKAYYIGAKLGARGKWEPVIWKTEDQKD